MSPATRSDKIFPFFLFLFAASIIALAHLGEGRSLLLLNVLQITGLFFPP